MQLSSLHVWGGALLDMTYDENVQQKGSPFWLVGFKGAFDNELFKGMIFRKSWPKIAFRAHFFIDKCLLMEQFSKKAETA